MPTRVVHVSFAYDCDPDGDPDVPIEKSLNFYACLDERQGGNWARATDKALPCGEINIHKGDLQSKIGRDLRALLRNVRKETGGKVLIRFQVDKRGLALFTALVWQHAPDFFCDFSEPW